MDMEITPHKIVEQNELQIVLRKTFEFTSYVMGYHEYKDCWTPMKSDMLKAVMEPKNKTDKFAVAVMKNDCLVGHLPKEKTGRFAKMIFYFLRACDSNTCSVEIVGKAINQGDGKRMKVPCKLHFAAEDSFINIWKEQLQKSL